MTPFVWNPDNSRIVRTMWNAGARVEDIANAVGTTPQVVYKRSSTMDLNRRYRDQRPRASKQHTPGQNTPRSSEDRVVRMPQLVFMDKARWHGVLA